MAQRYNPDTGEYEDAQDEQENYGDPNPPAENTPTGSYRDFDNGSASPSQPGQLSGRVNPSASDNGEHANDYEQRFKDELGGLYDPSIYGDFLRNTSYNGGQNQDDWFNRIVSKNEQRATNIPGQGNGQRSAQGGNSQLSELMAYLQQRQQQEDAQRQAMRDILMQQITENSKPVTQDDPQIHSLIANQQLARQRAAERQRSQIAANLAGAHLGSSGAADTGMNAIEQQRGEGESYDIAKTMGGELQQRRTVLQNLLNMAVQSGDNQSAQTLQAQLHAIDSQLNDSHFQSDLGFRQSSFLDDLGMRLLAMQLGANQNAANAFL